MADKNDDELVTRLAHVPEIEVTLSALDALRDQVESADLESDSHATLARILALAALTETSLGAIEPILVTPSLAAQTTGAIKGLSGAMASYWASQGADGPQIVPAVAAMADQTRELVSVASSKKASVLPRVTRRLEASLQDAANRHDAIKEKGDELTALTRNAQGLLDESTSQLEKLTLDWKSSERAIRAEATKALEADRRAFSEVATEHDDQAEQLIDRIRKQLGISGDYSLSAAYGTTADTEDSTADTLRNRALIAGIVAVVASTAAVVWAAIASSNASYEALEVVPLKIVGVAVLGGIAAYLGRQSERHRNFARRLRVNQLELNNIGDYLSELSPDLRADVKKDLVGTFFGQHDTPGPDDSPTMGASSDQLIDLVKLALKK